MVDSAHVYTRYCDTLPSNLNFVSIYLVIGEHNNALLFWIRYLSLIAYYGCWFFLLDIKLYLLMSQFYVAFLLEDLYYYLDYISCFSTLIVYYVMVYQF